MVQQFQSLLGSSFHPHSRCAGVDIARTLIFLCKGVVFHAPIGIMLSRLVSSSGYVLEGKEGSLCRWQSKLRPHLGINDTHVKKLLITLDNNQ